MGVRRFLVALAIVGVAVACSQAHSADQDGSVRRDFDSGSGQTGVAIDEGGAPSGSADAGQPPTHATRRPVRPPPPKPVTTPRPSDMDAGSEDDAGGDSAIDAATDNDAGMAVSPKCVAGAPSVTVASLLAEMGDLGALSRRGPFAFTTYEVSSRDPRSVLPEPSSHMTDSWFANLDWGNYLRVEVTDGRTEYVMLDTDGPGAIVRMWTAWGMTGTIRIYLDDMATPVIAEPFDALLAGQVEPYTAPFGVINSLGRNFDFPLPFAQHAKVTVEGEGADYFYQIFVRDYPACANVETFDPDALTTSALNQARAELAGGTPADDVTTVTADIDAVTDHIALAAAPGGSEIVELRITPSSTDPAVLRHSVLSFTFDGIETVHVPLGDFFGGGPGFVVHATLPVEVTALGTFISRFVMPFVSSVDIELNMAEGATAVVQLAHRPRAFTADSYYFFAHWTARGPLDTRPYRDVTLADVKGPGKYVGTVLALNDVSVAWWGEGDEKIWIDGEAFPRYFGTGTEDYFGYSYGSRESYDHPYRFQRPTGTERGQIVDGRFHVFDTITFETALRFDMELWHWDAGAKPLYDTLVYFYAADADADQLAPTQAEEFRLPGE